MSRIEESEKGNDKPRNISPVMVSQVTMCPSDSWRSLMGIPIDIMMIYRVKLDENRKILNNNHL
jgi:CRISPR/Cas system-associated exonuclease Cas4 (RecB family)